MFAMPWVPHYSSGQARAAVENASTWANALDALGYVYHGKNIKTLRKWAETWGISTDHLPIGIRYRYTEAELRRAISASSSWVETLRRLGYCHTGANSKTVQKRAREWAISSA